MNIKFISTDQDVRDNYPVLSAKKLLPKWFKDLPTDKFAYPIGSALPTIKKCMPATDMLTSGYIIQNVTDIDIIKEKVQGNFIENRIKVKNNEYAPDAHRFEMCPVKNPNKQHWIKLKNPWLVRTPPGYSCLFIHPMNRMEERWKIIEGVVDTDSYVNLTNFPFILKKRNKQFLIKKGDPMVQVVPFKRESWKAWSGFYIEELHGKTIKMINSKWVDRYKKMFWSKKSFK